VATNFVANYAEDVTDWTIVKKEILKSVGSDFRKSFAVQDPKTKRPTINDFEVSIIQYWEELTGRKLIRPC